MRGNFTEAGVARSMTNLEFQKAEYNLFENLEFGAKRWSECPGE